MSVNNQHPPGVVYIMTNAASGNAIASFRRNLDGTLAFMDLTDTRGRGTGTREVSPATPNDGVDPLASQGSLALSNDKRFLFAVNAGSNSITSFSVAMNGTLRLADVTMTGGIQPNCLGIYKNVLYVAHVGNRANDYASNITGFFIGQNSRLIRIPVSTRMLSTRHAQPARVVFTPDGKQLVVSELTTNRLSVYRMNRDGTLSGQMVNPSNGEGPFGSCFLSFGMFLVAEAGTNALSSYTLSQNGMLRLIRGSVGSDGMATCWVVSAPNERFVYTSNAESGTISFYRIGINGMLSLIESTPSTPLGTAMGAPIDIGISSDGQNLYVLNGNLGTISAFRIDANGRLTLVQTIGNNKIPRLGTQGLAVL